MEYNIFFTLQIILKFIYIYMNRKRTEVYIQIGAMHVAYSLGAHNQGGQTRSNLAAQLLHVTLLRNLRNG